MALLDDLTNAENFRSNIGLACSACEFINTLEPAETDAFLALLDNPKIPASAISRVLERNDIQLKAGVLNRHRRKECRGARR